MKSYIMLAIVLLHPFLVQASPGTIDIKSGEEFVIEDGGGALRHFPFAFYENGVQMVSFSEHPDGHPDHPVDGLRVSLDNGATWPIYHQYQDFYLTSITRLADGSLLGMHYITQKVDAYNMTCYFWMSYDNGVSWTKHEGNVLFPQAQGFLGHAGETHNWGGFVFHRSMFLMPDGSLQGTVYGRYDGDTASRTLWIKSVDNGANWTVVSTVAYDHASLKGFSEPVVAKVADGSLLAVLRTGSFQPLYQCRSLDGGLTWSTPAPLPGVFSGDTHSVDADLILMDNGTLVLSYGREQVDGVTIQVTKLLFSLDGSGYDWDFVTNRIFDSNSSCYTGIREVAPDRLLVVTDDRNRRKIIGKFIDITRNDSFERDALDSVPEGYTLVGAGAKVVSNHSYSGGQSLTVHDASTTTMVNIVKEGVVSPRQTFEAQIYPVTAQNGNVISLNSGANGNERSVFHVRIKSDGGVAWYDGDTSDGSAWNTIAGAGTVAFNAWNKLRIVTTGAGVARIYVNDELKGTAGFWNDFKNIDRVRFMSGATVGTGDHFYIDDVRLIPDVMDDFEADPLGWVPSGYEPVSGWAGVSYLQAYTGTMALRVKDQLTTHRTCIAKLGNPSAKKILDFKIRPVAAPNGNVIALNSYANGFNHCMFYFAVKSDGSVVSYDGVIWTEIAAPGSCPMGNWSSMRIEAQAGPDGYADLYINGDYRGFATPWNVFKTIDRVNFMTGSIGGTGDEYYVDDVYLTQVYDHKILPGNSAAKPAPNDTSLHKTYVARARQGGIDVLFAGDSITQYWTQTSTGKPVWDRDFAPLNAVNFGVNGERTQHMLWRMQNGEAEGYSPKAIVVLAGTNNTGLESDLGVLKNTAAEIAEGVGTLISTLQGHFPDAKIVLLGVLPRWTAASPYRAQITEINQALAQMHNGDGIRYVYCGAAFLNVDGEINTALMPDKIHPNTAGYEILSAAILPIVEDILSE